MTFNFLNYYTRMVFSQPATKTNKVFLDHSSLSKSSKEPSKVYRGMAPAKA